MSAQKCERCDEPIKPVSLAKDWPNRIRGMVTLRVHRIRWVTYNLFERWRSPRITNCEMDLCDECWASLLEWVNQPVQQRLRIAADNRRAAAQRVKVAEERLEREIERLLAEDADRG